MIINLEWPLIVAQKPYILLYSPSFWTAFLLFSSLQTFKLHLLLHIYSQLITCFPLYCENSNT